MSDFAIKAEGIGKKYRIGHRKSGDLRESFGNFLNRFKFNKQNSPNPQSPIPNPQKDFWALKDISFEIKSGEAVGIIGRNGAGKSTLLKILSRITEPTTGKFWINGRVSSLLEVGTGFHPELTGRENIYLNGTILGMKRKEIKSKFDEIVDFSGVEQFIDTPVKHYSSGMKVRLAFSVAAHLEPEILLIDEVLAVGDSTFQKKCIDKMSSVVSDGRAILFVSHNMTAVTNLCERGVYIDIGRIIMDSNITQVVSRYMEIGKSNNSDSIDVSKIPDRKGKCELRFDELVLNQYELNCGNPISFRIRLKTFEDKQYKDLLFGLNIKDVNGNNLVHLSNIFLDQKNIDHQSDSDYYTFTIKKLDLKPGRYYVSLFIRASEEIQDWIDNAAQFEIIDSNIYGFSNSSMISGLYQPDFSFYKH